MTRIALLLSAGIRDPYSGVCVPALRNLISSLSRSLDITVYSLILDDDDDSEFLCGNAKVKFVQARHNDNIIKKFLAFRQCFAEAHRIDSFKIVHGFWAIPCGFVAVVLGILYRIPSIVSLQGGEAAALPAINYGNMLHAPVRFLTLWTCAKASVLTALTQYQATALKSFGLQRNDSSIIPFGSDTTTFGFHTRNILAVPIHFLHVGNLNAVKDQVTLLKAFCLISKHVDCILRIVGLDTLKGSLQRTAHELGISSRVEFLGFVPHPELKQHYEWATVLLHTSLYEGQGVVISEGAAAGAVICGTRVGLVSDLGDESALSVDVGDYTALATQVVALLNQPQRFTTLQTNAYNWALEHTAEWTTTKFCNLYHRTLKHENTLPHEVPTLSSP